MPRDRRERRRRAPNPAPPPPPERKRRVEPRDVVQLPPLDNEDNDQPPLVDNVQQPQDERQQGAPVQPEQPVVNLRDDQLERVAQQVTANVVQQLQQREATEGAQGNGNITINEVDDNLNAQVPSVQLDLGYQVPNKLKLKIVSGEYVDLGALLTKSVDVDDGTKHLTVKDGSIILDTNKATTKIVDINQWTNAFIIFASIYTNAHPSATSDIFKYMYNIRLGASRNKGLGWKHYDTQFRLRKEKNPTMSWSDINHELWMLYMYGSGTSEETKTKNLNINKCYDFNYKGLCARQNCPYLHRCLKCSFGHPIIKCRVSSAGSMNSRYQGNRASTSTATGPSAGDSKLRR